MTEYESCNFNVRLSAAENISAYIEGGNMQVIYGDNAKMDTVKAINYIKSGAAEIAAAVAEGTADFNENAIAKTRAFNDNVIAKTTDFNDNASEAIAEAKSWAKEAQTSAFSMAQRDLSNLTAIGEQKFAAKQDVISDLAAIRAGAQAGTTALQSISSSDVTTALGYTPYNASNPSGYITSAALAPYALDTNVVHKTGDETILGEKTFNHYLLLKKSSDDFSITPQNPIYTEIRNTDVNDKEIGQFRVWKNTDGGNIIDLLGRYQDNSVNIYGASVGVKTYPNGDSCGYCEQNAPWAWGALVTLTSQNHSTNGYVKYSNGLIIQWMNFNYSTGDKAFTFPIPFTTTNIGMSYMFIDEARNNTPCIKNISTTGGTFHPNGYSSGGNIWLIAIGY